MPNIVTSVTLERVGAHERVGVWVHGKKAGELVVGEYEAVPVAALLLGISEDVVRRRFGAAAGPVQLTRFGHE